MAGTSDDELHWPEFRALVDENGDDVGVIAYPLNAPNGAFFMRSANVKIEGKKHRQVDEQELVAIVNSWGGRPTRGSAVLSYLKNAAQGLDDEATGAVSPR